MALVPICCIILTIAEAVALVLGRATILLKVVDAGIALFNIRAVPAFTFLAIFVIFGTATVAAIPSATSVVAVKEKNACKKDDEANSS